MSSVNPFETILVAVADPADAKQPAVERGAQIAQAAGARLVLFHAAFEPALSGRPFFDSNRLAKSRGEYVSMRTQSLERHARRLRNGGLSVDVCAVWEEPAHEAVIRAALREKADLVVAGRHERRANRVPQFRLTDWELMRLCPRPLLLVHPTSQARASGAVLAALDPTHANDKPANLDTSIVRYATSIAEALGVECHAVHALPLSVYKPSAAAVDRRRLERRMYSRMKRLFVGADTTVQAVHVVHDTVVQALPALARKLPAQVLAMGIISRRWMKRIFIGDTAESVIRDTPCDLLLVKPHSFRLRLGRAHKEAVVFPKKKERR